MSVFASRTKLMKAPTVLSGQHAVATRSGPINVLRRVRANEKPHMRLQRPCNIEKSHTWSSPMFPTTPRFSRGQGSVQKLQSTAEAIAESGESDSPPPTVIIDNSQEDSSTVITIECQNVTSTLAGISNAFTSLGVVVLDAAIDSDRETGRTSQQYIVTSQQGGKIEEGEHETVTAQLLKACESSSSTAPAIYGVAAAAEVTRLRTTGVGVSDMAGGQGAMQQEQMSDQATSSSLEDAAARGEAAAALELAAAEMAQAAAALVQVEHVSAELATKITGDAEGDEEIWKALEAQEQARVEASAVLERRMAAMEAALASRRQFKRALKIKKEKEAEEVTTPEADIMKQMFAQGGQSSVGTGPGCGQGYEIFLQAFNWESWRSEMGWYNELSGRLDEMKDAGFTAMWLPPPSTSVSEQGYLPTDLYNLNSKYGSENDLKDLLNRMRERGLKSVADIVVNHRCASSQKDGRWNQFGGRLAWNESVITCNNPQWGGTGARSTGDEYEAAPNIDHTQEMVRKNLTSWMQWLRQHIGYDGWRFDFVKGYSGTYTREYIDGTVPLLAFGEYWDACGYSDGVLDYNQNAHRQRTVDWCDSTGGTSGAFDFTTKGILQEAVAKQEYWRLVDAQGKPSGMMGVWPSRAVTFIDNHDTGSTLNHWPFPSHGVAQGYAYILTHPGTPTIFWDHWEDQNLRPVIKDLINVRKKYKLHARSRCKVLVARAEYYSALIDDKVAMKVGPGPWSPNRHPDPALQGGRWEVVVSGNNFAVWVQTQA